MSYENALALKGKRVRWTYAKGTAPYDRGGVGQVIDVQRDRVRLSLAGLAPWTPGWQEAPWFNLADFEMDEIP